MKLPFSAASQTDWGPTRRKYSRFREVQGLLEIVRIFRGLISHFPIPPAEEGGIAQRAVDPELKAWWTGGNREKAFHCSSPRTRRSFSFSPCLLCCWEECCPSMTAATDRFSSGSAGADQWIAIFLFCFFFRRGSSSLLTREGRELPAR